MIEENLKNINKNELLAKAEKNIKDILDICIKYNTENGDANMQDKARALVIFDTDYELTNILTQAYKNILPDATFIEFKADNKQEIINSFDALNPGDLVVMLQSTNFLLSEFRIRLHLFNKNLKVVEHMHLERNTPDQWETYVDSLAYDTSWYPIIAPKLRDKLANSQKLELVASDAKLTILGDLEPAKLNIGDYSGMTNIGGTFPIGEVFTEAKNFESMNGEVYIYAFADSDFNISMHEPFKIKIENGLVTGYGENTPDSFVKIYNLVKDYERPLIREIGFGLNRAITKEKYLNDITAFERILGMHLSLGEKHSVYKKEGMATKKTKFHVDLFPAIDTALVNGEKIFEWGEYFV